MESRLGNQIQANNFRNKEKYRAGIMSSKKTSKGKIFATWYNVTYTIYHAYT